MNYLTQRQKIKSNSQNSIQNLPDIVRNSSQDLIKKKTLKWSIADSQRKETVCLQENLIDNNQSTYRINQTGRLDMSSQRVSMEILDLTVINKKPSQVTVNCQEENRKPSSKSVSNYIKELEEFLKGKSCRALIKKSSNSSIIEKGKQKQGKLDRKHLILKLMKTNLNSTQFVQKQKWNEILFSSYKLEIKPKQIRQTQNTQNKIQSGIVSFFKDKSVP